MNYSFKILSISGIPIKIHWSFPLLLLWVFLRDTDASWEEHLFYGGFIMALFVCVVLHELGHALSARRYGVKTIDIILSPIGGVARLTHLPSKPIQEFIVAAAGPAVNVVIAIILGLLIHLFTKGGLSFDIRPYTEGFIYIGNTHYPFWSLLLTLNLVLVLFNLIPAFPMDGGRMFRALLSVRFGRLDATKYATGLGKFMAIAFGIYGLMNNPFLIFIGVFVFISANSEYKMVQADNIFSKHSIYEVMRPPVTIPIYFSIQEAADILADSEEPFLIVTSANNHYIAGMVSNPSIIKALADHQNEAPITSIMKVGISPVDIMDNVKTEFRKMQDKDFKAIPVLDQGILVGIMDYKSLNNFLKMRHIVNSKKD